MAENGIRSPNLPSASLIEVLGHYDAGGGQRALGRTSIEALVDALRGVISTDPTGVAALRAALTQAENSRISADDSLQHQIYDRALASSLVDVAKRVDSKAEQIDLLNVAKRVDTKAEQVDLLNLARRADAKVDQTALDATNAAAAALSATVDANNLDAPVLGRPGDDPRSYTYADTFAQIVGPVRSLPRVPARLIAVGDNGSVLRLDEPAIIATRRRFAVEPDRLYRPRAVLRRRVNVADPSNDAVQVSVVWLDQAGGLIGTQIVASLLELNSGDGRTSVQSTFALAAGTGVQLPPAPAGTRYARLAVQSFAYTGRLDLEVLDIADVTDANLLPPLSSDFVARLEQQESVNAGDRLDVVEASVSTPAVQTFKAVSDAAAAKIKPSVATIRTLGQGTSGDGGGSTYVRALAEEPADFTSQGGTRWRQTLDGLTGALPCSWTGLRKFVPPAIMMVASLIGSATAGDLGFGTPIQRITAQQAASSPNRPQQDALGAWWEIVTAQGVSVGWFGAKYDVTTPDSVAIQAALSCGATQINGHPGISNAGNLIRPASKIWNGRGGYLRPTTSCSAIMTAKDGGSVLDTHFAGNLVADQGLVTDGPRIVVAGNYVEYCNKGYANTANGVAITFNANGSAHCTYGRYSGGGSNNSVWIGERSDNDTYGAFYTYDGNADTAQPQAVRWFGHCMLGNQFGIWFDKNHYVFESYGGIIDVCYQTALRTAANGAVITVIGGFLSARGVVVDIGEGSNGITFDTVGIANGVVNLLIRASATAKCENVSITRCDIGTASSSAVILDSPDRTWVLDQNSFAPYYPSGVVQIATRRTYTANNASVLPAKIRDNTFRVRDGAVSTDLTECKGNIGWVTKQTVAVSMPANATAVACPLAMSVAPTMVTNVRAQGDVGFVSADTFSTSGMLVKCTKAPLVDTIILMTVEADLYLGAA